MNRDKHGQFYLFNNETIGRVVDNYGFKVKLRKVSLCKGTNKPYTYQIWMKERDLNKAKRIGTEELLLILFERKRK